MYVGILCYMLMSNKLKIIVEKKDKMNLYYILFVIFFMKYVLMVKVGIFKE